MQFSYILPKTGPALCCHHTARTKWLPLVMVLWDYLNALLVKKFNQYTCPFLSFLWLSDCFDFDIEYSPGALEIETLTGIKGIKECQARCQKHLYCEHFIYWWKIIIYFVASTKIKEILFHRGDKELCILKEDGAADTRILHSDTHAKKPSAFRPTSGPKFCPESRMKFTWKLI